MSLFGDFGAMMAGVSGGSATLTIASGKVASDLTNFPLYINLADMPARFWTTSNRGKDLRANVGGTQVPLDMVWLDPLNKTGAAFVKVPTVSTGSTTTVNLTWDGSSDRLANSDTYGRNNVWSAYESVFLLGETCGDDRTGKAQANINGDPDLFEMIDSSGAVDLDSHQGVCWDGTYYYTTDTNAIYKWDASWSLVDSNTDPIGDAAIGGSPTVSHCGDLDVHNGLLYIPMECWPASGGLYNAHIGVFDASTLNFVTAYDIHAQAHEAASIAYCEKDGLLYIVDYDGNHSTIYKYSIAGSYIGTLTTSIAITERQGITWWRDNFWISQDTNDETSRVSYSGTVTVGNAVNSSGGIGFGGGVTGGSYEGIGHRDDALLQVKDTGTVETVEAWRPRAQTLCAGGGIDKSGASGEGVTATGRASFTTLTLGVTVAYDAKAQNRCAISYIRAATAASSNRRAVVGYRDASATLGIWDLNNSWLNASPTINPTVGTYYRLHGVWQSTTSRKLYVNGAQAATQSGITAVPSDLDAIYIGFEDTDYAEATDGRLGFAYLIGSALSANWLAAEYSNINAPGSFYSIA